MLTRWISALTTIVLLTGGVLVNVDGRDTKIVQGLSISDPGKVLVKQQEYPSIKTPREYEDYLTTLGRTDSEALKVKEQFSKLSLDKQKKCIYYMTDPKVLREIGETEVEENSKKKLYNGILL